MKPVLLGVVGLLAGLGIGTGLTVQKNQKATAEVNSVLEEMRAKGVLPALPAHGDSTHADSTHADSTHGDSTKADSAHGDSAGAHGAPAKPEAGHGGDAHGPAAAPIPAADLAPAKPTKVADAAPAAKPAEPKVEKAVAGKGAVQPAAAPAGGTADAATKAAGYKQLARIFGNMKAADAVKVMALMTDDEVEGVLRALPPKQTAEMIGQFPKERAASLSRRLLTPTSKS